MVSLLVMIFGAMLYLDRIDLLHFDLIHFLWLELFFACCYFYFFYVCFSFLLISLLLRKRLLLGRFSSIFLLCKSILSLESFHECLCLTVLCIPSTFFLIHVHVVLNSLCNIVLYNSVFNCFLFLFK